MVLVFSSCFFTFHTRSKKRARTAKLSIEDWEPCSKGTIDLALQNRLVDIQTKPTAPPPEHFGIEDREIFIGSLHCAPSIYCMQTIRKVSFCISVLRVLVSARLFCLAILIYRKATITTRRAIKFVNERVGRAVWIMKLSTLWWVFVTLYSFMKLRMGSTQE